MPLDPSARRADAPSPLTEALGGLAQTLHASQESLLLAIEVAEVGTRDLDLRTRVLTWLFAMDVLAARPRVMVAGR